MKIPLGKHILAEYFECKCDFLHSETRIRNLMLEAASRSGATIIGNIFHRFNPQGVTGVVVIAESHFSIHTWPEIKYASLDLFTCGDRVDPWLAFEYIKKKLQPGKWSSKEIIRGNMESCLTENRVLNHENRVHHSPVIPKKAV